MNIDPTASIAPSALLDRTWPRGIHIGARCRIDEDAVVLSHDMTRVLYVDTRIGAGTWIGPRAIVLPGVSIGEDCIIMPGAIVTKDVPARSTAMGNPAAITPRDDLQDSGAA